MARKKFESAELVEGFELEEAVTAPSSAKLPVDISGGKKLLDNYMAIPVENLEPFHGKRDSDFARHSKQLTQQMIDSAKQFGIVEAIVVRPLDGDRYEIVSGESRWTTAKAAGLATVPCKVIQSSDAEAEELFSILNLLRRDLSYRDRINGWWHYCQSLRARGEYASLLDTEKSERYTATGQKMLSGRQIQRYEKLHNDLLDEWITILDNGGVGFMTTVWLSVLPKPFQRTLIKYEVVEVDDEESDEPGTKKEVKLPTPRYHITEGRAKELRDIYDVSKKAELPWFLNELTEEWKKAISDDKISFSAANKISRLPKEAQNMLLGYKMTEEQAEELCASYMRSQETGEAWPGAADPTGKEKVDEPSDNGVKESEAVFKKAKKGIIKTAQASLRREDYSRASEVIEAALKLYYEQQDSKNGAL